MISSHLWRRTCPRVTHTPHSRTGSTRYSSFTRYPQQLWNPRKRDYILFTAPTCFKDSFQSLTHTARTNRMPQPRERQDGASRRRRRRGGGCGPRTIDRYALLLADRRPFIVMELARRVPFAGSTARSIGDTSRERGGRRRRSIAVLAEWPLLCQKVLVSWARAAARAHRPPSDRIGYLNK